MFGTGLSTPAGHVLPLRARGAEGDRINWESGVWSLRGDRLFLLPGDSPMGYRLPLDALPWEPKDRRDEPHERDPLEARPPLGVPVRGQSPLAAKRTERAEPPGALVRTALCVEPREGVLNVFMPPLSHVEEYLALVGAVEDVARDRQQPVRVEGYPPPFDPRIEKLSVTPDPGVIEVNIQPTRNWPELSEVTSALYEEAAHCRLGTEKFMLDGRHTGTGGGNHVVLGGATPADSPFLRRPDLLRSFIGYTINHPSLSYLFSGLFVGPTSQAPRVDEARQDNIHELELAFAQVPDDGRPSPWLVDRIFRNLLVDVTGNTHRTEILHRQALQPGQRHGAPGVGRAAVVRDAAPPPDEPHAAADPARADRLVLARAVPPPAGALGDGPRRSLHAAPFRRAGLRRRARRPAPGRLSVPA